MQPLEHYLRPFLAAQRVVSGDRHDGGQLQLIDSERRLVLTIAAGKVEAARDLLEQLRRPDAECWREFRERRDPGLSALLDQLDRLGWIREADASGRDRIAGEAGQLADLVRESTDWLVHADPAVEPLVENSRYGAALARLSRMASLRLPRRLDRFHLAPAAGPYGRRDIAVAVLALVCDRWQVSSPAALRIFDAALRGAVDRLAGRPADALAGVNDAAIALADPEALRRQVWSALALAVLAAAGRYRRDYAQFVPPYDLSGPGVNLLIAAEAAAERLTMARGRSPILGLIDCKKTVHRTAIGACLHQYLLTTRSMEAVYVFLQHNLRPALKAAATRYMQDETGHEELELAACQELGVSPQELTDFVPLPFFSAYPEALSAVAERDPLAFCLAVSVAEGLPGGSTPIAVSLAERGIGGASFASHQEIDKQLDHALVTRQLMQYVPWVEDAAARAAIKRFLFIVEFSQLCWRQLADYAASDLPRVPVAFGIPASKFLNVFAN